MTNFALYLRRLVLPALFLTCANLYALNISEVKHNVEGDGFAVSFCNTFKIENIEVETTPFGDIVVMPKDLGGYKNLIITSGNLAENIKICCLAKCESVYCKNEPVFKILESRKTKSGASVTAKVSFDGELTAVFLISRQKRAGAKDSYRVKPPQDFKFINSKYKENLRRLLIEDAKKLI